MQSNTITPPDTPVLTNKYKCKHKLNQIFRRLDWEIKYYDQNQITYIVFDNDHSLESCQNSKINPLAVAMAKISKKKKFKFSEVVVEWKQRYNKDTSDNICSAGFVYFHFYTKQ
ncbi:23273_t:CDS:2, partial [Gigaspora margarita]